MKVYNRKEMLENMVMVLKCMVMFIAIALVSKGHVMLGAFLGFKEVTELVLFCKRLLLERRYQQYVLHNQADEQSVEN